MDATMRATCPSCQASLKIPAAWAGQAVKCKKCGAVVRARPKDDGPFPADDSAPLDLPNDDPAVNGPFAPPPQMPAAPPYSHPAQPQPGIGSAAFTGLEMPGKAPRDNPFEDHHTPAAPLPHDSAGYYPPGGYMPPPGYAPPPGYPYPPAPGYGMPAGYMPPPGYPYPLPPGYGPPPGYPYPPAPGYGLPPGYLPYPYPPQMLPPGEVPPQLPPQPPAPAAVQPPMPVYNPPPVQQPQLPRLQAPAPPPQPVPDSVGLSTEFKAPPLPGGRARLMARKSNPAMTAVWVGVCLFLTGGLIVAGIYGANQFKKKQPTTERDNPDKAGGPIGKGGAGGGSGAAGGGGPNAPAGVVYPRRMLFVHISHYMYLNPLTYSERTGFDRTRAAADRLAYEWHVPNDAKGTNGQLFYLSDTARNNPVLPLKPVVVGAFEKFFETSRAQDRIIVYFGGHAAEKDGKAYLVPAEGDLEDVATLIPVADIYAKLGECPATQKVVIWDVCRFNPERGRSRPGSEPMTEKLAEALSAAPPGVQVVLTCQPGENALEFFTLLPDGGAKRSENVSGSSFLEAVRYVGEKNKLPSKDASPAEPFPVEDWVKAVDDRLNRVSAVASGQFVGEKLKQSVKLAGSMPEAQTAYNSAEAPAARFEFPKADSGATASEVAEIFDELQLPQIDAEGGKDGARDDVRADALIPFRADQLADFKDDLPRAEVTKPENREKYLFRVTVIEAFAMINDLWGGGNGGPRIEREFKPAAGSTMATEAVKKEIEKYQDFPATAGTKLESMLTRLEAVEGMRAAQPKRWQAHYDYAVAQVKARLAFLDEYNARLGNVRTDVLPELDPKKGQDGYRLVSSETIKSKKAKEYADDAKERFDKIIADYKGTPWAIQARRDKTFAMGLVWQPFSSGAGMPDPK